MPIVIGEIVTEVVVAPAPDGPSTAAAGSEPDLDLVVRRAVERVLEVLRREWDR